MKTSAIILALGLSFSGGLHAQSQLPEEIYAGTEPTSSKEFKEWTEKDPTAYGGNYTGDVGGDSSGVLELKFVAGKADTFPPFTVSGMFKVTPAGQPGTKVTFDHAYCDPEVGPFVDASAFKIHFVVFGDRKGVVVGDIFLPKE